MRQLTRLAVSSLAALSFFSATLTARAQDGTYVAPAPQPANSPPPPPGSQAQNGQYVAPLAQTTQQIYVPQSVAMSGPARIKDWDDTQPVPPGYHVTTETRKGMLVGGLVMFGTLWVIDLLIWAGGRDSYNSCVSSNAYGGNQPCSNTFDTMWVPGAGPFLQMASSGTSATGSVFLAIDGIAQCAGIAMFIYGLAAPRTVLVRNDLGSIKKPLILPMKMGQDGAGLGLLARF